MSNFRGVPQRHDLPSGYCMGRQLDSTTYEFGTGVSEINFRDAAWFGSCPLLTAAMARGEIKRVDVKLVSGAVCRVAMEADPDPGSGKRWNSADSVTRIRRVDYTNAAGSYQIWLDSNGAGVVLEIEVHFDIPAAVDV